MKLRKKSQHPSQSPSSPNFQNEKRDFQNEKSALQNEKTIPEITTEITSNREEGNVHPLIPKEIYDLYSDLYGKQLSLYQYNQLTALTDNRELITYVIKTCKEKYNARTFEYIRKTLADWTSNGVQTVSEAKQLIEGDVIDDFAINDEMRRKQFAEVEKFLASMGESKRINQKFYHDFERYRE